MQNVNANYNFILCGNQKFLLREHEREGANLALGWLCKANGCKMDAQRPRMQLAKVHHCSMSCFLSMRGELFSMYFLSNTKKHSCNAYANLYLSSIDTIPKFGPWAKSYNVI